MTGSSMARIVALCLACCSVSALAHAEGPREEHAPPPPILLDAPPPPERPTPEHSRRPFELSAELLLGLPSCADGSAGNQRCDGMAAGPGLGATALWRPSPYFAFGGTLSGASFAFRPAQNSGLAEGSADGYFWGLLGRVYFFDHGLVEPYLELGLGSGQVRTRARELEAEYEEESGGLAVRAGGAIEFYLSRHVRLGPAFDWTRFNVSRVRRCGRGHCVALDDASNGQGTGFSNVSVRLSVLLGPGL